MSQRRSSGPDAPARLRRAATFAATSAVLASIAHSVGGAALPDLWLLLLGSAAIAAVAYPVLGREATAPRIALGLAAAQAALHGWLTLTAGHAHAHGSAAASNRMLAAHAVATAVAVVWLRYAEDRLWRRARQTWVRWLLGAAERLTPPPRHPAPALPEPRGPRRATLGRPGSCARGLRGPPLLAGP